MEVRSDCVAVDEAAVAASGDVVASETAVAVGETADDVGETAVVDDETVVALTVVVHETAVAAVVDWVPQPHLLLLLQVMGDAIIIFFYFSAGLVLLRIVRQDIMPFL